MFKMSDKHKGNKLLSNIRSRFASVPKAGSKDESEDYDSDSSTSGPELFSRRAPIVKPKPSRNQADDAVEILNHNLFDKYFTSGNKSKELPKQEFKTYLAECYDMQWVEMQDRTKITSITWNLTTNCFACGCTNGLLKVIQVDKPRGSEGKDAPSKTDEFPIGYLASATLIVVNETLSSSSSTDGHRGTVTALAWNPISNKLASGDETGLIIVWDKIDETWFIEKKNNENTSSVIEIQWSNDGERLSIAFEDGEILLSLKNCNKLRKLNLKEQDAIAGINWSPISSHLLVAFWSGNIHLYDELGESKGKFKIDGCEGPENKIERVCWYSGSNTGSLYKIAVILKNDKLYLYKNVSGKDPKCLSTSLINKCAAWSSNGLFLCIGGVPFNSTKDSYDQIQVYNASGNFLFKLNIPYKGVRNITWDPTNLRIAIAPGSNIFFANIRPFYAACFCGTNEAQIIYTYTKDHEITMLNIWDGKMVNKTKEIPGRVIDLKGSSTICGILTFDGEKHSITVINPDEELEDELNYITCGDLSLFTIIIMDESIVGLSRNAVLLWKYKSQNLSFAGGSKISQSSQKKNQIKAFHIDSAKSATSVMEMTDLAHLSLKTGTLDPIICGDAKQNILVVGRQSGKFHVYSLSKVRMLCIVDFREAFDMLPKQVFLNCDATKIGIIDKFGTTLISALNKQMEIKGLGLRYQNVMEMTWAKDLPDQFFVKKHSKIFIVSNGEKEEPILRPGTVISLKNMELQLLDLSEIMHDPENPKPSAISKHESEALKHINEMLTTPNNKKINFEPIINVAQKINHPELWKMIIKKAMYDLKFEVGERGFIETQNYAGICLIKKLWKISNDYVKLGKIAIHYKDFEEAEKYFGIAGRNDLINELRADLGEWNHVDQDSLFRGLSAKEKAEFQTNIGNYLAKKGNWDKAKIYYKLAGSIKELLRAFLITEDYGGLMELVPKLPEGSPYFDQIGTYFAGIGCCEQAVEAFVRGKFYEKAVNCCLALNRYSLALEISNKYRIRDTEERIFKNAAQLVNDGLIIQAIDLFKSAKQPIFGIWIATMFALKLIQASEEFDAVFVMELFKLSLQLSEVEETNLNYNMDPQLFAQYMPNDLVPSREIKEWLVSKPDRGLIALETFVKLQQDLYAGNYSEGVGRGIKLMNYMDILGKERIGCLVVLISANAKRYDLTSKAFMVLESCQNPEKYKSLAYEFFAQVEPVDRSNSGGSGDGVHDQNEAQRTNSLLMLLNKLNMNNK